MVKQFIRLVLILLSLILIFACKGGNQVELEVEVKVTLDSKPGDQAKILIDGTELGLTDGNGYFSKRIKKQPGSEVQVAVRKDIPGHRIEPWKGTFVVKLPKDGAIDTYPIKAELNSTQYFTVVVIEEGGNSVGSAKISIQGKLKGETNESGEYVFDSKRIPSKGIKLGVTKDGYSSWRKTVKAEPGQTVEVTLAKSGGTESAAKEATGEEMGAEPAATEETPAVKKVRARVTIAARTDFYGIIRGVSKISVRINNKRVGKTNSKGFFVYKYTGAPGKEVTLKLSAPGYIPEEVEKTITLKGKQRILQFFYPATPKPIKVGIYDYVNNTPEEDLTDVLTKVEDAISNNLFVFSSFRELPKEKLRSMMLKAKLDMETATKKGWQNRRLIRYLDMIVSGSVAKSGDGYIIETTVTTSNGKIILSQINKSSSKERIGRTCKVIVKSIVAQFPFEGAVAAAEDEGFRINLPKNAYMISRGNEFNYMAVDTNKAGKFSGFHEAGKLRVVRTDESASWAEVVSVDETEEIKPGAKMVRRIYLDSEREEAKATCIVSVKGGLPPDGISLWGVNIYLNNTWVGTTGTGGKVEVPIKLYEDYTILLSRHGYQPLSQEMSVDQNGETKAFNLEVASALFKVESEPSEAAVFVDNVEIGRTPIIDGKPVNFGFRKIKLSVGGEYRDWEKVVEFNKSEVEFTGENMVVFLKDYLKIGKTAEKNGSIDAAIAAYSKAEKGNPDYSNAHHRLAQLYMDEKNDFGSAIREFENVLSLPENRQIIYKQYAVTYTNLGHAYYEKGNSLIRTDKLSAARNFAKAIEKLNKAKQNTRFFPSNEYDEAVHDTYYYRAISYHKLYLTTKKRTVLNNAKHAWREYFDFYPKKLEGKSEFEKNRTAAKKYWNEIKNKN